MDDVQELVNALAKFANVMSADKEGFAKAVLKEHPTIQQNMFGLFLKTIEAWSNKNHFDLRNEYTVTKSKEIMTLLEGSSYTPFI